MEQLSPSLRTRIYVIAGLEVAGIVLDIVMNASLLDLQPPRPGCPCWRPAWRSTLCSSC